MRRGCSLGNYFHEAPIISGDLSETAEGRKVGPQRALAKLLALTSHQHISYPPRSSAAQDVSRRGPTVATLTSEGFWSSDGSFLLVDVVQCKGGTIADRAALSLREKVRNRLCPKPTVISVVVRLCGTNCGSMSDSTASERLVLSEVHVGSSALDEETEVVSRYTYLTPTSSSHGTNVNDSSSDSSDSEADEGESGDDSSGNVARRRKRPRHTESQRSSRPAHEVLTVVHRMATTLGLVGQQVWSAAFLLGDFVLTHEDLFAGKQVRFP